MMKMNLAFINSYLFVVVYFVGGKFKTKVNYHYINDSSQKKLKDGMRKTSTEMKSRAKHSSSKQTGLGWNSRTQRQVKAFHTKTSQP